jgi:hypothetical protein
MFRGYMPRSILENVPVHSKVSLDAIRLSGESILAYSGKELDWEMPYDLIQQADWNQQDDAVAIQYKKNKKVEQTSVIYVTATVKDKSVINFPYDLEDWTLHLNYVLDRYKEFTRLATEDPERFGAIVSKDAFLEAKKKKEQAKISRTPITPSGVDYNPSTHVVSETPPEEPVAAVDYSYLENVESIPEDEEDDGEYDSDSDDSVEFRPSKRK